MDEQLNKIQGKENSYKPLVSIVVVTYNAAAHLEQCFQSILQTTFSDYELLVFDGNSTDGTLALLEKYNQYIQYWQSEPDNGIYDAMNKAVKKARARWILFLGADDRLLDGFSSIASILADESCIYYGDFAAEGKTYGGKFSAYRLAKSNLCHQNILYPYKVFEKYSYDVRYKISADHYLNMQCWADQSFKFQYYPYVIAQFSKEGVSSLNTDEVLEKDRAKLIKKYLGYHIYLRYRLRLIKLVIQNLFKGASLSLV